MKLTLADIQKAQQILQGHVRATQMIQSISATKLLGSEIYFKLENEQLTGSFKLRGALNKLASLTAEEKKRGVVASSAGNHAQGVALGAQKNNIKATIVMPTTASLIKIAATKDYGADVVLSGEIYDEAYEKARQIEKEKNLIFVHPYQDEKVMAGQGTIGLEVLAQIPDLDSIVIPIGGGGLVSGVATAIKALNPKCKIIGVQSSQAPGMQKLFKKQDLSVPVKQITTIADGIAIKKPSKEIYDNFISKLVDDIVTVNDDEIAEAIVFLLERAKTVAEGSGAASLAAIMNQKMNLGKKCCVLISGGNIDLNIISKVISKGLIRKGRLAEISVIVDDLPGNLSRLTKVLAELGANIIEVHHDRVTEGLFLRETRITFVLETFSPEHIMEIQQTLTQAGAKII